MYLRRKKQKLVARIMAFQHLRCTKPRDRGCREVDTLAYLKRGGEKEMCHFRLVFFCKLYQTDKLMKFLSLVVATKPISFDIIAV